MRESGREGVSEERVIMLVLLLLGEEIVGGVVVEELRLDWARPIWLWETVWYGNVSSVTFFLAG